MTLVSAVVVCSSRLYLFILNVSRHLYIYLTKWVLQVGRFGKNVSKIKGVVLGVVDV